LGDAGAAAMLRDGGDGGSILHQRFQSISRYWDATTVPGGGSAHPRGDEYTYFRGDGARLRQGFHELGPGIVDDALTATGTTFEDYRRFFVHQVSAAALADFADVTGIPMDRVEVTVGELGNMAAASLPVAYAAATERGDIGSGDLVMLVGLGAGLSAGVVVVEV
jgi:3-oxoacyl-[acyl-carrier-protein] synthase-3